MKIFCKKLVKYILKLIKYAILSYLGILAILGVMALLEETFWPPRPMEKVMAENYELHKAEIVDLQEHFELITDNGKLKASIEFSWLGISRMCANLGPNHICYDGFGDDKENYHKVMSSLGWNDEIVKTLKKKLKRSNCISIHNFIKPLEIGFEREGFAMYSYLIYDPSDKETKHSNESCRYYQYKNNIVFKSESGVFSPLCFESKKK